MKQRISGKNSRVSLDPTKRLGMARHISDDYEIIKIKEAYRRKKKEDKDTNERQDIHRKIIALVGYGFPMEEVVKRLEKTFPDSKYKTFFDSWVKDRYAKVKPSNSSREDDLSL